MLVREKCSCCGKRLTTKQVKKIGRNEMGLWLNCFCGTTILLENKKYFKTLNERIL